MFTLRCPEPLQEGEVSLLPIVAGAVGGVVLVVGVIIFAAGNYVHF